MTTTFTPKSTFTRKAVTTGSSSAAGVGSPSVPGAAPGASAPSELLGVYRSLYTGQPLVSSGLAEIDDLLGGGLPVGSMVLVEEDDVSSFSDVFLKYFLAQGVVLGHSVFVASADETPSKFLDEIPTLSHEPSPSSTESSGSAQSPQVGESANLKIAWQYEKYLSDQKSDIGRTGAKKSTNATGFDLMKAMKIENAPLFLACEKELINVAGIEPPAAKTAPGATPTATPSVSDLEYRLKKVYASLSKLINKHNSDFVAKKSSKVLRVCLKSFLSPLWGSCRTPETRRFALQFLHAIKGLLRTSNAVAVVSFPRFSFANNGLKYHFLGYANYIKTQFGNSNLNFGLTSSESESQQTESNRFVTQLEHLFDSVVEFESFKDLTEVPQDFHDFHGFFHIRKVPSINVLTFPSLEKGTSYTFKLKRKKMHIEPIHLQPEISRSSTGNKSEKELNDELKRNVSQSDAGAKPAKLSRDAPIDKHHIDF